MMAKDRIMITMAAGAALRLRIAENLWREIYAASQVISCSLKTGGKLLLFGNGGSAADAQHLAAEFVNRFHSDSVRGPLAAIALTTDTSVLTAIGNDFSFEAIFSRQVMAHGKIGDVALGITTSGSSANVLLGLQAAKSLGMTTIALTREGSKIADYADLSIEVPSISTPLIQEAHIAIGHLICELAELDIMNTQNRRRTP